MFSEKFALCNVGLDTLVEDTIKSTPSLRNQGFLKFSSLVLHWFDKHPELGRVHLLCVTIPAINNETNLDICVNHHITIDTAGSTLGRSKVALAKYMEDICITYLPVPMMGGGVFSILRTDPLVQEYLKLTPEHEDEYKRVRQAIASKIDASFGLVFIYHDTTYLPSPRK
jgi:hypothetical protein